MPAKPSLAPNPPHHPSAGPARSPLPVVAGEVATIQATGIARAYEQIVAMNEALIIGALRQHELTEAAESLNAQLQAEIVVRKKTAAELAEKARLLDLTTDAIFVRDSEGRIIYWNHGAEKLYGWPREEALGKISHELLHTAFSTPVEQITTALHQHHHWSGELVHTKRDGRRITVLVRKTQDLDAQGKPAALVETITDITERKQMEDELRQARTRSVNHAKELDKVVVERTAKLAGANQQLEAFVYSIAHDLRGPLRAMQGFSQLLVEEAGAVLSQTGQDYAARINKSAQFMDCLLGDLLDFSRISHAEVELSAVDLGPVVAAVLSRLQPDIQAKSARVENAGPWPVALAHAPTLTQVLFNLVSNALKFTRPDAPAVVRLRAEDRGEVVRVWVEDNGIGIAPEHLSQIFRPFIRLDSEKYGGTGIGLSIVQNGIERMGRQVGVESRPGHGSQFWIELTKAPRIEGTLASVSPDGEHRGTLEVRDASPAGLPVE